MPDFAPWIIGIAVLIVLSSLEMRQRLGRVESKLNALLREQGVEGPLGGGLSERVKEIANDPARKIEAIKAYRDETGAGLADAKAAVEAYINGRI